MRNLSFLSDTDSDSNSETAAAVNELLSQAKDLCVLEQIAAVNCSSFSDDSVLASDLESRFARLKSLPAAPNPTPAAPTTSSASKRLASQPATPSLPSSPAISSPSPSSAAKTWSRPDGIASPAAATKSKRFDGSSETPSMGCTFWCSPKKGVSSASAGEKKKKKKIKEVDWARRSDFGWSRNEELLEDLGSFSIEEQRKILKKAMVEQKKISDEARKIVKMAKKAPTGKSVNNGVEDELSD